MDLQELLSVALRCTAVYFAAVLLLRASVRHPVVNLRILDVIVILVIGEVASRPVCGESALGSALGLMLILGVLHWFTCSMSYASLWVEHFINGTPRVVIRNGEVSQRALTAERLSERDLRAMLRAQRIERLDEVKLATLEPSGQLTVIRTERAQPVRQADLQRLLQHPAVVSMREAAR